MVAIYNDTGFFCILNRNTFQGDACFHADVEQIALKETQFFLNATLVGVWVSCRFSEVLKKIIK